MKEPVLLICLLALSSFLFAQSENDTVETNRLRFGGYGEILFQRMDYGPDRFNYVNGSQADSRAEIGIPRLIFSCDYTFKNGIDFSSEIEFEHGGTGSALELEYEEMGEYEMEMEKAGEVVIEQFHLTKTFNPALKLRVGHMIVPVGLTNSRHLPVEFFTAVRPEGESAIVPLTWHETGVSVSGRHKSLSYELQLINGLDANGFSSSGWIKNGKQSIFESTKMTNPAVVARLDNTSVKSLRVGASFYFGNSTANTAKPAKMEHLKGRVAIGSLDAEYNNSKLIARGNCIYGELGDSYEISKINKSISKNIQYSRTPVAQNALTYSIEVGYDIFGLFGFDQKLFPFVRYEYYNSMQAVDERMFADARFKRDVATIGLNYFLSPEIAVKADYAMRTIDSGNYNDENTLSVAVVFATRFISPTDKSR